MISQARAEKQLLAPSSHPRPYQREDIGKLKVATEMVARVLYVAFMGSGKTVVASMLARHWRASGERVLYLVHRFEILKQTEEKLRSAGIPRSMMGFVRRKGSKTYGLNLDAPIQVASIDTLRRRDVIPGITRIVVDEAHHTPAGGWAKVLAMYPGVPVLGLTGTPVRLDGRPLSEHFDRMVVQSESVEALIAQDYLARPEIWTRPDGKMPDRSKLQKTGGREFSKQAAARSMSSIIGGIPAHYLEHAKGLPAVLFAATEKQVDQLLRQFTRAGVAADKLMGHHADAEHAAKLRSLETGAVSVLCTCDVLGEGWDFPAARCVILACPTASLRRYLQWCGRCMRPGSPPIILDHAGNFEVFGPPWEDRDWEQHFVAKTNASRSLQAAVVAPDGRVVFREPVELDGKLVRADVAEKRRACSVCGEPASARSSCWSRWARTEKAYCDEHKRGVDRSDGSIAPCAVCGEPSRRSLRWVERTGNKPYCEKHLRGVQGSQIVPCVVCGEPATENSSRGSRLIGTKAYCEGHSYRYGRRRNTREPCVVCGEPSTLHSSRHARVTGTKAYCAKHPGTDFLKGVLKKPRVPCFTCGDPSTAQSSSGARSRGRRAYCEAHAGGQSAKKPLLPCVVCEAPSTRTSSNSARHHGTHPRCEKHPRGSEPFDVAVRLGLRKRVPRNCSACGKPMGSRSEGQWHARCVPETVRRERASKMRAAIGHRA